MASDEESNGSEWITDDQIARLKMEAQLNPDESTEDFARRLFTENSASAAASIIHIALNGSSEKIRLDASKYVTERVLGPASNPNTANGHVNPWDELLRDVVKSSSSTTK